MVIFSQDLFFPMLISHDKNKFLQRGLEFVTVRYLMYIIILRPIFLLSLNFLATCQCKPKVCIRSGPRFFGGLYFIQNLLSHIPYHMSKRVELRSGVLLAIIYVKYSKKEKVQNKYKMSIARQGYEEKETLVHRWECILVQLLCKSICRVLKKIKNNITM